MDVVKEARKDADFMQNRNDYPRLLTRKLEDLVFSRKEKDPKLYYDNRAVEFDRSGDGRDANKQACLMGLIDLIE
jgi:hypothetical protein